jgi:3-oxoacyl-[acyl-carrier protein] reductase
MDGKGGTRRALVTGASRGIGRQIARVLAEDGVRVAVHYGANQAMAEETLSSLPGSGHVLLQADLADEAQAAGLADRAAAALGGLDILVNNAGIFREHPVREVDAASWAARWKEILAATSSTSAAAAPSAGSPPPRPTAPARPDCTAWASTWPWPWHLTAFSW